MNFIKIPDKDFEMMDAPIVQKDWTEIMGNNPSYFKGDNLPVEMISYNDCLDFINKLNEKDADFIYRLPTEEEWEYCCRAGSITEYCFGDDEKQLGDYAWFYYNSENKTHEVKLKKPNAFGLYDMHGNVWEWTSNLWDENYSYRVFRGGCWGNGAQYLRSAVRYDYVPGNRGQDVGARLVRTVRNSSDSYPVTLDDRVAKALACARDALAQIEEILK